MHSYHIIQFEEVTSTNEIALQAGKTEFASGTVYVAKRQTAGRGRRGRTWESSLAQNLYFSLLLCPKVAADKAHMVTIVMADALASALRDMTGSEDIFIKWPNDIVMDGKKVSGILTEMGFREDGSYYVVVGVGVNVGKQQFADELSQKATDLESQCGVVLTKEKLLETVLVQFEKRYEKFETVGDLSFLLPHYNGMLINRGRNVRVLDPKGEYEGVSAGINTAGELLVKMSDGSVKNVYAGEVSVRGIYGYV